MASAAAASASLEVIAFIRYILLRENRSAYWLAFHADGAPHRATALDYYGILVPKNRLCPVYEIVAIQAGFGSLSVSDSHYDIKSPTACRPLQSDVFLFGILL